MRLVSPNCLHAPARGATGVLFAGPLFRKAFVGDSCFYFWASFRRIFAAPENRCARCLRASLHPEGARSADAPRRIRGQAIPDRLFMSPKDVRQSLPAKLDRSIAPWCPMMGGPPPAVSVRYEGVEGQDGLAPGVISGDCTSGGWQAWSFSSVFSRRLSFCCRYLGSPPLL